MFAFQRLSSLVASGPVNRPREYFFYNNLADTGYGPHS